MSEYRIWSFEEIMRPLKLFMILGIVAVLTNAIGCNPPDQSLKDENSRPSWRTDGIRNSAINNAIIAQHTFYPYHFIPNASALNELGEQDLEVLAAHYRYHPGPINIRRGSGPQDLYEARVQAVRKYLIEVDIDDDRIVFSDGLPGGRGMPSEQVLKILARGAEETGSKKGGTSARKTSGVGAGSTGMGRGYPG